MTQTQPNAALDEAIERVSAMGPRTRIRFPVCDVSDLVGFADRCARIETMLSRVSRTDAADPKNHLHRCDASAAQRSADVLCSIRGTEHHHDIAVDVSSGSGPLATCQIVVETGWDLELAKAAAASPAAVRAILEAMRRAVVATVEAVDVHGVGGIGTQEQCDAQTHLSNQRLRLLADAAICADPVAHTHHQAGFNFTPSCPVAPAGAYWVWDNMDMNPDFAEWFDQPAVPQMVLSMEGTNKRTYRLSTQRLAALSMTSAQDPVALVAATRRLSAFDRPAPTPMISPRPR